jgi:hypothetical protein
MHESWEDNISEEEQWAKIKTDIKSRRTLRRIVSQNHRTTAAQVTGEVNIHLEHPVSTGELNKSNIQGRAAISKLFIPENNAQMRKLLSRT